VYFLICVLLTAFFGVVGVGYAFVLHTVIHGIVVYCIARHLSGFAWSPSVQKLILVALSLVFAASGIKYVTNLPASLGSGFFLVIVGCVFALRGLASRLGAGHRIVVIACKAPLGRLICGT
jgi:hypothetical protein